MKNKTILIISSDAWGLLPASKHHYALELAKNNLVYYLNPLSDKPNTKDKGVNIINKYTTIKGLRFLPQFVAKILMKIEVISILNKIEKNKIDIVWSFDSSRLYFLDLFRAKIKIAHIVDYVENFNFKELISSADICLSVADCITENMLPYNKNIFKINHGYFNSISEKEKITLPSKTGVYIGNLSMIYIDWAIIYKLASNYKEYNFWFFGPISIEKMLENEHFQNVGKCSNVVFHKPINPEQVVNYLISADFCFLNYQFKEFGRQLDNSHKLMQYLGSGTPIFSSYTYEYKDSNLFTMYFDENDVLEKFDAFITNKNNDFSEEARTKRINFALDNTYSKQVERINKLISHRLQNVK